MTPRTERLLLAQGYSSEVICHCANVSSLARWTPSACAVLGVAGVLLQSPQYLVILGLLTSIGALGSRSFYDYLYVLVVRHFWDIGEMPRHGSQRRFGCGVGAGLFILSGLGFWTANYVVAHGASLGIVSLAAVAALTQWCFASALWNGIFGATRTA